MECHYSERNYPERSNFLWRRLQCCKKKDVEQGGSSFTFEPVDGINENERC